MRRSPWRKSCDKASLYIFWLKDDSLEDSANLPDPGVLAAEIVEDLEAALELFRMIAGDLKEYNDERPIDRLFSGFRYRTDNERVQFIGKVR